MISLVAAISEIHPESIFVLFTFSLSGLRGKKEEKNCEKTIHFAEGRKVKKKKEKGVRWEV